jgi:hypothetical protein
MAVVAVSGSHASPDDGTAATFTATGTSVGAGTITPTQNNELIVSSLTLDAIVTGLINSDLGNIVTEPFGPGVHFGSSIGLVTQGTAAGIAPTWSWVTNATAATITAAFRHS